MIAYEKSTMCQLFVPQPCIKCGELIPRGVRCLAYAMAESPLDDGSEAMLIAAELWHADCARQDGLRAKCLDGGGLAIKQEIVTGP